MKKLIPALAIACAVAIATPARAYVTDPALADFSNIVNPDARVNLLSDLGWSEAVMGAQPGFLFDSCAETYKCGLFLHTAPTDISQAFQSAIRIDRSASYTNDHPVTATGGDGTTAVIQFSGSTDIGSTTIPAGHTVVVSGVVPAGYNGTYVVTSTLPGQIAYANTTTGAMTQAGTVRDTTQGGTVKALWVLSHTSPTGALYEWPITSEMHNQTGASLGHGAQNVAINGTAFKEFKAGFNYGTDQIGPTWGGNFACNDSTGSTAPTNSCIGAEIDTSWVSGTGADTHKSRVGLQIAWGANGSPTSNTGDHAAYGILMGPNDGSTMDNAIELNSVHGSYGNIMDVSTANINGNTINGNGWYLGKDGSLDLKASAGSIKVEIPNDATGTAVNGVAILVGNPSKVAKSTTSTTDGGVGIVSGGAGTTGNAQVTISGFATCAFDAGTTAGDYVTYSSAFAANCHDVGIASRPTHGLGRVLSTNATAGFYMILVSPW